MLREGVLRTWEKSPGKKILSVKIGKLDWKTQDCDLRKHTVVAIFRCFTLVGIRNYRAVIITQNRHDVHDELQGTRNGPTVTYVRFACRPIFPYHSERNQRRPITVRVSPMEIHPNRPVTIDPTAKQTYRGLPSAWRINYKAPRRKPNLAGARFEAKRGSHIVDSLIILIGCSLSLFEANSNSSNV